MLESAKKKLLKEFLEWLKKNDLLICKMSFGQRAPVDVVDLDAFLEEKP